jgi:methylphosphotriester-DNA--protein-cysteine methyltransferase
MKVTMTMRELDRLKCIQGVVDRQLKLYQAAERLGLTTRQLRRLVRRYTQEGPVGLISRHRNRPSNSRLKAEVADRAFGIIREQYADFGPTLAAEKLRERHGVDLDVETVRSLMVAGGLWLPRRLRAPRIQQPRIRRACLGELIQIDGCEHHWFENRAPACTTLVYVDDATSRLMVVLFTGTESTFGYFEATRQYLVRYGKPLAFYSDKASVFRINNKSSTGGDGHTQFGRALYELNIDGICANTPAAKGRVERAHLTLQDRLVKELRLERISTVDAANELMPSFIEDYNRRFGKLPRDRHDAHRAIREDEHLDTIFAWRETRKVTSDLTLHYERKLYLLPDTPSNRRYCGKYLDVLQYPDGRIEIQAAGVSVPYSTYDKLGEIDQGAVVENKRLGHMLRISQVVQAERDNRSHAAPSTAHRASGMHVSRKRKLGLKTQRELGVRDLHTAMQFVQKAKSPRKPSTVRSN